MEVIRIEGMKKDEDIIKHSLEVCLPHYPIFIINKEKVLYRFIEELGIYDDILFRLKVVKEIDFTDFSVMLKDKFTEDTLNYNITSLSKLLEIIDENIINNYNLVIDTEDRGVISEIIQALIYLNIQLEVMMKKEIGNWKQLNGFRRRFNEIREAVVNGKKALYNLVTPEELALEKEVLINILNDIEEELEKARERNLNISIMATKKAGKSVVVNSFLKEQYAPTSLELPTPNTCIYRKSTDGNIRLLYGQKDILFKTPEDMYKYTYNEFKKAQNDKKNSYTLEDMEIYYKGSNSSFTSFTLIDTPGSNYALAKDIESGENSHKKIAYKWIEKSDVVLFLINYSSYLSIDEEDFLKSIKSEFEKHNKFYSLIVIVNKLDEMITSECENKSVVRFLDYIRCKLKDLGYKDFIVMGTSARSYFDAIKACGIYRQAMETLGENLPIEELKGSKLREALKTLKKKFMGRSEMNTLSFIDDQLDKLEWFYGLEDYDLNSLKEISGMPKVINYATHIAMNKAQLEVYGPVIESIDEKYSRIKNIITINALMDLKKNKLHELKEVEDILENIIYSFKCIEQETEDKLSFKEFTKAFLNTIEEVQEKRLEYISNLCESRIDEFFIKLMLKESEELKKLKNRTLDIDITINNKILNEEMNNIIESFLKELRIELDKKESYLKDAESKMKSIIITFSEIIRKEYDMEEFNIDIPKIEQYYKKLLQVNMPSTYITNALVKEKILEAIEVKGNVISKVLNFFMKNKYGDYVINSHQLQRVKREYWQGLKNNTSNEYRRGYDLLRKNLLDCVYYYEKQIDKNFKRMKDTYKDIILHVLSHLSNSKDNMEKELVKLDAKLQFNNDSCKIVNNFLSQWDNIRN